MKLSAEEVLAARWTLAALLFAFMALVRVINVNYKGKPWYKILLVSFAQPCVSALCETIGVDITSPSISAIFYAMIPIVVMVLSVFFLKVKLHLIEAFGVTIALVGIMLSLVYGSGEAVIGSRNGLLVLGIMVIASALFIIFSKWALIDFEPIEITFMQAIMAAVWFNALVLLKTGGLRWIATTISDTNTLFAILFLGAIGSCVCYIVYQFVLECIPAVQASTIQINLISITGVVSGIIINHDPCHTNTVVGVILVLVGVYICNKNKLP